MSCDSLGWAKRTTAGTQVGKRLGCCQFVPFKGQVGRAKIGIGHSASRCLVWWQREGERCHTSNALVHTKTKLLFARTKIWPLHYPLFLTWDGEVSYHDQIFCRVTLSHLYYNLPGYKSQQIPSSNSLPSERDGYLKTRRHWREPTILHNQACSQPLGKVSL